MRIFFLTLAIMIGCSADKSDPSDSSEPDIPCPGDSIHLEVCISCDDAGECDAVEYDCRSICDADEDCPADEVCLTSNEGNYCDSPDVCE